VIRTRATLTFIEHSGEARWCHHPKYFASEAVGKEGDESTRDTCVFRLTQWAVERRLGFVFPLSHLIRPGTAQRKVRNAALVRRVPPLGYRATEHRWSTAKFTLRD